MRDEARGAKAAREMRFGEPLSRCVLLVEDDPEDARLVSRLLAQGPDVARVRRASSLAQALGCVERSEVDVTLLDLTLPDCSGIAALEAFQAAAPELPIVVQTRGDDGSLFQACLEAGAQDCLAKETLSARELARSLAYALSRVREAQLRKAEAALARYRDLSSATQGTSVTAALAGSGAVAVRAPATFERLVCRYCTLFEAYVAGERVLMDPPRDTMEAIATAIGNEAGGPRDLMDVHVEALERTVAGQEGLARVAIVVEARLLALKMMGMLVDYYRVGSRRSWKGGQP